MVAAASQGIGRAAAEALAREGCRVSICARDPKALEAAREEMSHSCRSEIHAFACDVMDREALKAWHDEAVARLGPIEILVTNTGGPPAARFLDLTEEQKGEADEEMEAHGVKILCDMKSYLYLNGTEIDFKDEVMARGFVFKNPNATSSCGCGTSFTA